MGMRFCGHAPNSPRNKNPNRHISNLFEKVIFGPQKTVVFLGHGGKNFFFNFECYDLANGKE
jgi:hypothetical protein